MVGIMQNVNATDVRKNWSLTCDEVVRVRPSFIKRTHDNLFLSSTENMINLLAQVVFKCRIYKEHDGSYTATLESMDIAENAETKDQALNALAQSILDYAEEYYESYELYSKSPNRANHLPFITKALLLNDTEKIKETIQCRSGKI